LLTLEKKPNKSLTTQSKSTLKSDGSIKCGAGGTLEFVRLLFHDEVGRRVEMVTFGSNFSSKLLALVVGSTYKISNAQFQFSKESTRLYKHQYNIAFDLSINSHTTFEKLNKNPCTSNLVKSNRDMNNNVPTIPNLEQKHTTISTNPLASLPKLNELSIKDPKSLLNIIGIIDTVEDEIKTKVINGQSLKLRNFYIIDQTSRIKVAIWGKEALSFDYKSGNIVLFNNIQLSNYDGISLSVLRMTRMTCMNSLATNNPIIKDYATYWQDLQNNKQN
jgi:hypothetical protein